MSNAQDNSKISSSSDAPITGGNLNKTISGKENVGQGFSGLSGIGGTANAIGKPFNKDGVLGNQFTGGSVGDSASDKIAGIKKN